MDAIPTIYKGLRFRSRLEATWAAFFDALGWPWSYEPIDLSGYIPDFILNFRNPLLVEVKPETQFTHLARHQDKIEVSGWEGESLIVGARLFREDDIGPIVGLLDQSRSYYAGWDAGVLFRCADCGQYSIHHASGYWVCYVNGCYRGNGHIQCIHGREAAELWADAKNAVQWRESLIPCQPH